MKKELLQELVTKRLPTREIAKELSVSQSTVKHWLRKFSLKTNPKRGSITYSDCGKNKVCSICFSKLNIRLSKKNSSKCDGCSQKQRRYIIKSSIIEWLGGRCNRCGWVGHVSGFDLHHRDPEMKEFQLSSPNNISIKRIKEEAAKCELLCALCHRFEHSSYTDDFIKTIDDPLRFVPQFRDNGGTDRI